MTTQITSTDFPGLRLVLSDDGRPAYVECITALDNVSIWQALRMIERLAGPLPAGYELAQDVPFRVHVALMAPCACVLPEQSCPACREAGRKAEEKK